MELFAKIVNDNYFCEKNLIVDIWQAPKCASEDFFLKKSVKVP